MVKQNLNHTMYFVFGVLAITTVLKYNLTETRWHKSQQEIAQKRANYKATITENEIKNFMRLWPEFYQIGLDKDFVISSQIEHPEEMIKWQSRIWFVYHHTDPARFFYVQQRVDYLLNAVEIRRNARALIDRLAKSKDSTKDSITRDMLEFQQRRYAAEQITEEEQKLMNLYEAELRHMLKSYPFTNLSIARKP